MTIRSKFEEMEQPLSRQEGKSNLRNELSKLEVMIEELRVEYEQFFMGFRPYAPDKEHKEVQRQIRDLMKAPFKNSEINYRLRTLENRYRTYHTYWQRVNKQREEGTYQKDIFKANMRERMALEDARAQTTEGKAAANLQSLFNSYKVALEKQTGKKQNLDFNAFKKSLAKRAKDYKQQHGADKRLSFKVVVKDGKVSVQAKAK